VDVETTRLLIRDLVPGDLEAMVDLWGEPDVERWMSGFGPRTRAEVERWLPETIAFNEATPREAHNCAIVDVVTDRVVGWIGFGPSSRVADEVNFGYAVLASERGKSYGTDALRIVIDFCFGELGVRRFTGETAVGNDASARVMEKVGMQRTGVAGGQIQFGIDASAPHR
jgi:[ribosomal protein S5]-alanine N-acetyltransferase